MDHRRGGPAGRAAPLLLQEILDHLADHRGREPSVGDAVDLHDRGQRAAAEARDFLDREQPVGIGVVAAGDFQPAFEGVLDQLGPFHVAGGAVADVNDVLPDRTMAELVVERRNARQSPPA